MLCEERRDFFSDDIIEELFYRHSLCVTTIVLKKNQNIFVVSKLIHTFAKYIRKVCILIVEPNINRNAYGLRKYNRTYRI